MNSKYFSWTEFTFDHVAFEESSILVVDIYAAFISNCCVNIACMVPAWCFSNVNFVIFCGIFRSWSNEKHWLMTTLSLILFVINRATAMFLSSPNRFQMFSSRFRLTGAQKNMYRYSLELLRSTLSRTSNRGQKLSKSRQKLISTHRTPLKFNILCSLSMYSLCLH